jgi:hypothetical protein
MLLNAYELCKESATGKEIYTIVTENITGMNEGEKFDPPGSWAK